MNVMKSLRWLWLTAGLAAPPIECALAQQVQPPNYASIVRQGYNLGKAEAENLEALLAGNPDDLEARTKLLGYYWRGAREETPEAKIAARRRHILWLIEHQPASEVAGMRQTNINRTGRALVDPEGHEQAAKLWVEQAQRHSTNPAVLGNAAWYFLMHDKVRAEALLKQARQAGPHGAKWASRLGVLYAISILGLDSMNENFFPFSHNPADAEGEFTRHARPSTSPAPHAVRCGVFPEHARRNVGCDVSRDQPAPYCRLCSPLRRLLDQGAGTRPHQPSVLATTGSASQAATGAGIGEEMSGRRSSPLAQAM